MFSHLSVSLSSKLQIPAVLYKEAAFLDLLFGGEGCTGSSVRLSREKRMPPAVAAKHQWPSGTSNESADLPAGQCEEPWARHSASFPGEASFFSLQGLRPSFTLPGRGASTSEGPRLHCPEMASLYRLPFPFSQSLSLPTPRRPSSLFLSPRHPCFPRPFFL